LVDRLCAAAASNMQGGRYGTLQAIYLTNCAITTLLSEVVRLLTPPSRHGPKRLGRLIPTISA
jgi:hypothetical protein